MNTHPHPIDAQATRGLIAAVILIVGFGLLALVIRIDPPAGWVDGPSTGAASAATVAAWGD
jgi:hypothetical protein